MNSLTNFVFISAILFALGFAIVVSKKNLILMLMGVELMLNAVNINFVAFAKYDPNPSNGQIFSIMVMLIAAAEISVGLALVLKIKDLYQNINPEGLNTLKN
jgi:NADH:ubiquinone oxidoreductase subunit K